MIKLHLPTKTVEIGQIRYITFNKNNHLPYITDDPNAPALVYKEQIYMIQEAKSDRTPDKEYEYCKVEFLPDAINLLQVQADVSDLQKKVEIQDEQNITIMAAIADLYEKVRG